MVNADFSPLRQSTGGPGSRKAPKSASTPGFKEKPGFNTGVPGKKQSKDRSNGIKRAPVYPDSEGL